MSMRLLGLDFGERRIGLAANDALGLTAQGIGVYKRRNRRLDLEYISEKIRTLGISRVVMGLPLHLNGSRGSLADAVEAFGRDLAKRTGVDVVYTDERLTTAAAQKDLIALDVSRSRRRQVIDEAAAALILQGYMERNRRELASEREGREE